MKILAEFREFAVKGNAMDLAIGVVIGAAFQKIVDSLVNDIIMPPIGAITGKVDLGSSSSTSPPLPSPHSSKRKQKEFPHGTMDSL